MQWIILILLISQAILPYFLIVIVLIFQTNVYGDGFIIPQPGINISVKYHHVDVTIADQVALTEVDQVFVNDSDINNIEAVYVFPLPKGATFSDFSMYVDGVGNGFV